jgi:PPIC-type PPIASE domain
MTVKSTLGAALILGVALCAPLAAQEPGARTVLAVVNGTEIMLGHLIAARAGLPAEYQSLPDEVIFDGLLDQMIQQAVIEQSLEGKLTLREELALANERRAAMSAILVRQLADRSISEEAVLAAYEAQFAEFTPQTEYHASHILVDSQELALTLKSRIEAGEDFATLAIENSTDGSAAGGGDLGWFGLGQMVARLKRPWSPPKSARSRGRLRPSSAITWSWSPKPATPPARNLPKCAKRSRCNWHKRRCWPISTRWSRPRTWSGRRSRSTRPCCGTRIF